jgi:hypothetical protein
MLDCMEEKTENSSYGIPVGGLNDGCKKLHHLCHMVLFVA